MAVVDNGAGITVDATGQHNNGKLLDGLPAATLAGQAVRWDEAGAISKIPAPVTAPATRITPNRVIVQEWDLNGNVAVATGVTIAGTTLVVTSGATATILTPTATEIGYQQLTTGAGATASAAISTQAANLSYFLSSAAPFYFAWKGALPVINGTYRGFWGFTNTVTTSQQSTNSIGLAYDFVTGGETHFQFVSADGTYTPTASSALVTTGLWILEMIKPAGSLVTSFYATPQGGSPTLLGTTSILPSLACGAVWGIGKASGATNYAINMDWGHVSMVFPNGRDASFLA